MPWTHPVHVSDMPQNGQSAVVYARAFHRRPASLLPFLRPSLLSSDPSSSSLQPRSYASLISHAASNPERCLTSEGEPVPIPRRCRNSGLVDRISMPVCSILLPCFSTISRVVRMLPRISMHKWKTVIVYPVTFSVSPAMWVAYVLF